MFGFGRFGPMELILILIVALLVFGPKKLPEIGKSIGKAIREFKSHSDKLTEELNFNETSKKTQASPKVEVVEKGQEVSDKSGPNTEEKKERE